MLDNKIVILTGFSGAGKDTIAKKLQKFGFNFIRSYTTRPKRDDEEINSSYLFINKKTFHSMQNNNEFIEYRSYTTLANGNRDVWYYATPKFEIQEGKKYIIVLDMLGLIKLKEFFNERVVGIFIDAPNEIRENRAKLRGSFNQTEWDRRLADDLCSYPQSVIKNKCDFIVENIELDKAIQKIINIVQK